jgi:hypothetical protein
MYSAPFFKGRMMSIKDLWPPVVVNDITSMVNDMIFTAIPKERFDVKLIGICGDMGSGKTEMAKFMGLEALKRYGKENVNIIYNRNVEKALGEIDDKRVQLVFVDDASGEQNSHKSYENVDKVQMVFTTRHIQRMAQKGTDLQGGITIVVLLWQQFITLEKPLRKVHFFFAKTHEDGSTSDYARMLGGYRDVLRDISYRIQRMDQEAKSYSLCAIPSMFRDGNDRIGRGIYISSRVEDYPEFPDVTKAQEEADVKPSVDLADADQKKLHMAREIAYLMSRGMTQTEAGEIFGLKQFQVSKLMKWYRELGGETA